MIVNSTFKNRPETGGEPLPTKANRCWQAVWVAARFAQGPLISVSFCWPAISARDTKYFGRFVANFVMIQIAVHQRISYLSRYHHKESLRLDRIMSVNTFATGSAERHLSDVEDRLPAFTAGVVIFGLSLLCWIPLLLPVVAFFHH
jgi:hypothetical protein